jgi:hypothetical protein
MQIKSTGYSSATGFALTGEVLFFAPPKKSTPKKGGPEACPLTRVSCASRQNRRSPDSRSRLSLDALRHGLACPGFPCDARLRLRGGRGSLGPVARAEYRSRSGIKARILSEADLRRSAELCAPPERRGTQGIGMADAGSGCLSLWVLSLGHARESTSPNRAKPAGKA